MARRLLDTQLELVIALAKRRDPVAGYDSRCPACFPALLAPNRDREIGGGRATRQPGQVRKEAALTRSGSGRSSVSYLFFERIAQDGLLPRPALDSVPVIPQAGFERQSSADRSMTDAGAPLMPHNVSESADQGGFDLGGPPEAGKHYRVLARKYRPSSFDDLIGQDAMVRTVSNAFETGRIPQAWILTGVRGVGKTTTARILARALNYELPAGSVTAPTTCARSTRHSAMLRSARATTPTSSTKCIC